MRNEGVKKRTRVWKCWDITAKTKLWMLHEDAPLTMELVVIM